MPDGGRAIPPRLLTRAQLRAYLQLATVQELEERILARQLPAPLWGLAPGDRRARWDVRQVDKMLDAAWGPVATVEAAEMHLDRALGT